MTESFCSSFVHFNFTTTYLVINSSSTTSSYQSSVQRFTLPKQQELAHSTSIFPLLFFLEISNVHYSSYLAYFYNQSPLYGMVLTLSTSWRGMKPAVIVKAVLLTHSPIHSQLPYCKQLETHRNQNILLPLLPIGGFHIWNWLAFKDLYIFHSFHQCPFLSTRFLKGPLPATLWFINWQSIPKLT